jgi:hypothetical protein
LSQTSRVNAVYCIVDTQRRLKKLRRTSPKDMISNSRYRQLSDCLIYMAVYMAGLNYIVHDFEQIRATKPQNMAIHWSTALNWPFIDIKKLVTVQCAQAMKCDTESNMDYV